MVLVFALAGCFETKPGAHEQPVADWLRRHECTQQAPCEFDNGRAMAEATEVSRRHMAFTDCRRRDGRIDYTVEGGGKTVSLTVDGVRIADDAPVDPRMKRFVRAAHGLPCEGVPPWLLNAGSEERLGWCGGTCKVWLDEQSELRVGIVPWPDSPPKEFDGE